MSFELDLMALKLSLEGIIERGDVSEQEPVDCDRIATRAATEGTSNDGLPA